MKFFTHTLFFFLLVTQFCSGQWYQQISNTSTKLNSVYFIDVTTGWVVGDSGKILHTTNGGQEWITQMSGTIENLNDILFYGTSKGTIVGNTGTILRTTNAGLNWVPLTAGVTCKLSSVSFVDDHTGWIAGTGALVIDNGILLKTTNNGDSWNIIDTIRYSFINFIDDSIGWRIEEIVFYPEQLQKTTDGGINWNTQIQYRDFGSVCFLNENIGWVSAREMGVSGGSRIIKTIDGGVNWFLQDSTTWAIDLCFVDQNNGWAIDNYDNVKIKYSSDGGTNWGIQLDSFPYPLTESHFTDINNGWAVGDGGIILHTTNGGVTFVEEKEIDEMPSEFLLSQNYPNPFNPSTKIKYSIPQLSNVLIKVYDILGKEIETLVNEEKPAGTYEVTWYPNNLPSGIYFYQLLVSALQSKDGKAGSFVETKKMILLR